MSSPNTHETYTSTRGNCYTFGYEQVAGSWRIYIDGQPSYGRRATDADQTHRFNTFSRPFVCWTRPLYKLADAKAVAHLWANGTDQYIATGSFPKPAQRSWFDRFVSFIGA